MLSRSVSVGLDDNGMSKIMLLADLDRYYENNPFNQQLVSKLKASMSGMFIIQNNVSDVLLPLLEN